MATEFLIAIVGLNGIILATTIYNSLRIGKLQGRLDNGDFLRCPFYRKGRGVNCGEGEKGNK
ncbi:hypothetical protein LCGC14_3079900 [marine sediment metagenome]|uniref:Uncharacterized protein n=1 Tax=marine sediment metagenome TaxID=412755 RepID=A0A0F8YL91_9ZZZZ